MQVTGLVHDLGKLLFLFDSEGQWDVVGVSNHLLSLISELGKLIPEPSLLTHSGHIRRRLQLFGQNHISRDVRGKSRLPRPDLFNRIWHLSAPLRS